MRQRAGLHPPTLWAALLQGMPLVGEGLPWRYLSYHARTQRSGGRHRDVWSVRDEPSSPAAAQQLGPTGLAGAGAACSSSTPAGSAIAGESGLAPGLGGSAAQHQPAEQLAAGTQQGSMERAQAASAVPADQGASPLAAVGVNLEAQVSNSHKRARYCLQHASVPGAVYPRGRLSCHAWALRCPLLCYSPSQHAPFCNSACCSLPKLPIGACPLLRWRSWQ